MGRSPSDLPGGLSSLPVLRRAASDPRDHRRHRRSPESSRQQRLVAVEAHVGRGLPSLTLTGLYLGDPLDEFELSAEDSPKLTALMAISTVDVNRERLEFLG
jgi:hypothetical protein